jgi:hypothetical protein
MKKQTLLFTIFAFLIICNNLFSQTGESKQKMVIINTKEKKVEPLLPAFEISGLSFTDANKNHKIDGNENGSICFYLKNKGTIMLKELSVSVNEVDSLAGVNYTKLQIVKQIGIGDSTLVNIPVKADERLKDGLVQFNIRITDTYSDSVKSVHIAIPAIEASMAPEFTWINPVSDLEKRDFPIVDISGLVKTKSDIKGLTLFVNGQVPDDKKSFVVLATDKPDEYRITRTLTLNEGDNEIKVEAKNSQGIVTSQPRTINYYVQKIDNKYIEKRLALVIGNAAYINGNTLQNPVNDAKAIAEALKEVGFTVLIYLDSDLRTMKKAMDIFGDQLKDYTVGLFYYAGHGMQVKGNNYLIPVDASLKVEQDVDYDCVDAGRILGKMEAAGTNTNIVILDACRDNPFARSWSSRSTGGQGTGLAFMNAPSGSIVAYATSPGKTASDGTGKNGLYTEAILEYIKVPSLPIEDFFKNVRITVETKSNKTQTPWESTSLKGSFFFKIR